MASLGELGRLTGPEYDDLADRVDRFHAAWKPDRPADFEAFLPPADARHRPFVLVEMIKTDMELRARAKLPVRLETYLGRFRADIPDDAVPVSLLAEEYRLRHQYADRPDLEEYRTRFPAQYKALAAAVRRSANPPPAWGKSIGTTDSGPAATPSSGPTDPTRLSPLQPSKEQPAAPTRSHKSTRNSGSGVVPLPADTLPAELQYRLIRRIGKGAFGEVYEAEAPGGFRVALKKILRAVDHPASRGEIESLEAIKSIRHTFLVQTQAYWIFDDRLVIVMELADGSLADRIDFHKKRGQVGVPPEELIPYFEQAGEALDYLHSQNVSHRDVKPQNLLLLNGYAKVADFGLARGHQHTMTNIETEVGTPLFMAPEVWAQKMSLHSDQYALAASYVQARLGRPLYDARFVPELGYKHTHETPDLAPLPGAEQKVLLKALAKLPDERYPSCVAFAKALRRAVLDPPPPVAQVQQTRWVGVGLAIAAALVCGITVGVVSWILRPPGPPVKPDTPPGPKQLWVAPGWAAADESDTVSLPGGKEYYKRLTRTVAGEKLVAILIPSVNPGDPPAFYMLENKVTNRVFKAEWGRAENNPVSAVNRFREDNAEQSKFLLPGVWKNGVMVSETEGLGVEGRQEDVPAVGVTVPEAILIAEGLGGLLPTLNQWVKAVGGMDGGGDGPTGKPVSSKPEEAVRQLRQRGLALGLTSGPWPEHGPWPVRKQTPDVSKFEIHQLVSNGLEWTGELDTESRANLFQAPTTENYVYVVGQSWDAPQVLTLQAIRTKRSGGREKWTHTKDMHGFRIVLEPK